MAETNPNSKLMTPAIHTHRKFKSAWSPIDVKIVNISKGLAF